MSKPNITRCKNGPFTRLRMWWADHRPHWKAYGSGHASVEFDLNPQAGWLAIDTEEFSEGGKSSKRTMVTLEEEGARALHTLLSERFAPTEADAAELLACLKLALGHIGWENYTDEELAAGGYGIAKDLARFRAIIAKVEAPK